MDVLQLYPILEYDDTPEAIIEPSKVLKPQPDMPEACVLCFFTEVIESICGNGKAEIVGSLVSEIGKFPIYAIHAPLPDGNGTARVAVAHPGVGAPLSGGFLDELIAYGAKRFIACGGCGVLNRELAVGHIVVPDSAVRDEGTSYHYLPPAREVCASPEGVRAIVETLKHHDLPYVIGKTWTTDGIYRETRAKVARRRTEGCITVEMEAAAFFAVAQFRSVQFAQILYCGDDVSGEVWDNRDWQDRTSTREKLFWLAVESVLRYS